MRASLMLRPVVLALFLSTIASGAFAAAAKEKEKAFEPTVGQEGKDVVWVPTSQALVNRMLDLAKVGPNDIHYDLGSGDGRTVITAAKRGAKAYGVEYNPNMVALSRRNATAAGLDGKDGHATFIQGDIFETDFSKATVITLFLLPDLNIKLRPKILDMKPGTRVVSNSFTMGDWQSDQTVNANEKEGCQSYCTAYLWIVPAKVEGKWKLGDGELNLKQTFQMVSGSLNKGSNVTEIAKGKLSANQINFTAGSSEYTGTVEGNTMKGTVKSGGSSTPFTATKL